MHFSGLEKCQLTAEGGVLACGCDMWNVRLLCLQVLSDHNHSSLLSLEAAVHSQSHQVLTRHLVQHSQV